MFDGLPLSQQASKSLSEEKPRPSEPTLEDNSEPSEPNAEPVSEGSEEKRYGKETKSSEQTGFHELTISDIHEALVKSGNPISQRAITNWCHRNSDNEFLLDAFFDPGEKKYYVTKESVRKTLEKKRIPIPNSFKEFPDEDEEESGTLGQKSSEDHSKPSEQPSEGNSEPSEPSAEEGSKVKHILAEAASEYHSPISNDPVKLANDVKRLRREKFELAVEYRLQSGFVAGYEKQQQNVMGFVLEKGKEIGQLEEELKLLRLKDGKHLPDTNDNPVVEGKVVEDTSTDGE